MCIKVTNPDAKNPDWSAIIMKKNQCPPNSNGCEVGHNHVDFAVPGYDNLQYSTANICGQANTGFGDKHESDVCGSWWTMGDSVQSCMNKCASLKPGLRQGCELFSRWGWTRGDPKDIKWEPVKCP